MYGLISKLNQKTIYDFLSPEQLERTPVLDIDRDVVFIPAIGGMDIDLYYILEGQVDVISQSYNGGSFLIDAVGKNEFMGKFSHMRQHNFYADIKTRTPCKMLKLSGIKGELLEDEKFMLFFYYKTSNRLYEMYKISMMRMLYSWEEILAFYLLEMADASGFVNFKDKYIRFHTSISERHYYYLLKKFKNERIITQSREGIRIIDSNKLKSVAQGVSNFMKNRL